MKWGFALLGRYTGRIYVASTCTADTVNQLIFSGYFSMCLAFTRAIHSELILRSTNLLDLIKQGRAIFQGS